MSQERSDLRRTRASLFYLVAYLFPLSTGLLISPTDTFHFSPATMRARRHCIVVRACGQICQTAGALGSQGQLSSSLSCCAR